MFLLMFDNLNLIRIFAFYIYTLNIHFLLNLVKDLRKSIIEGNFEEYSNSLLENFKD